MRVQSMSIGVDYRTMPDSVCDCCAQPRKIVSALPRRGARVKARRIELEEAATFEQSLCRDCFEWLSDIVSDVRHASGSLAVRLLGAHVAGARSLVFGVQWHICREIVPSGAWLANS
jgi:hypothetical protein